MALAKGRPWPATHQGLGREPWPTARALATRGCSRAPPRNPRRQIVCAPRFSPSASNQFRVRVLFVGPGSRCAMPPTNLLVVRSAALSVLAFRSD